MHALMCVYGCVCVCVALCNFISSVSLCNHHNNQNTTELFHHHKTPSCYLRNGNIGFWNNWTWEVPSREGTRSQWQTRLGRVMFSPWGASARLRSLETGKHQRLTCLLCNLPGGFQFFLTHQTHFLDVKQGQEKNLQLHNSWWFCPLFVHWYLKAAWGRVHGNKAQLRQREKGREIRILPSREKPVLI